MWCVCVSVVGERKNKIEEIEEKKTHPCFVCASPPILGVELLYWVQSSKRLDGKEPNLGVASSLNSTN